MKTDQQNILHLPGLEEANHEEARPVLPSTSLRRFLTAVLPQVSRELKRWHRQLEGCSDWTLLVQATSSLQHKRFHAQGGSFYALYNPLYAKTLVPLIVAVQTISDYLDNLCDRGGIYHEAAFRCLHRSFLDALSLESNGNGDYYTFYTARNDGGYLQALVEESRRRLQELPSYPAVQEEVVRLASLYCDLQVNKHLDPAIRLARLKKWFKEKASVFHPSIYWWEFSAACGSTLAIFALMAAATRPRTGKKEVKAIVEAYFPWVCGLHILLDYFIDQAEDAREGDFNFVACYPSPEETRRRLALFLQQSLKKVSRLPHPGFHRAIVHGLLAVYLSDGKVKAQGLQQTARFLLSQAGAEARTMFRLCQVLRKIRLL
ncbi:MAG TPA: tetraprenyl-beta-curcumene synthase family protein [Bacillota bacterium]|nr:tetraprenyl-beta-curcumene synthase family protein [Bacillota bacterium]HOP69562.1 tetraprenyl-beta-curcumene synthase family protein [Bacillota bacterium]HPT34171.1 tetraprenyl-beta-curcumene synthase family protein [Bacillota bacterium]HQD05978.1 tetraprenyl-beta-curcumene synthase family protein [Bacillota bacterium]